MSFSNAINLMAWYLRGFGSIAVSAVALGILSTCPYIVRHIIDKR